MSPKQVWEKGQGYKENKGMREQGKEYKKHYQDGEVDKVMIRDKGQKHDYPHTIVEKNGDSLHSQSKEGERKGSNEGYQDAGKSFMKVFFGIDPDKK